MKKNEILKAINKLKENIYIIEYNRKISITCDDGILVVNAFDVNDNYISQQETLPEKLTDIDIIGWIDYMKVCIELINYQQIVIDNNLDYEAYKKISEYCTGQESYYEIAEKYRNFLQDHNLI